MKRYALLFTALVAATSCNSNITGLPPASDPATETFAGSLGVNIASMTKMSNGVYYKDIVTGNGADVTSKSDTVWVTYAGYFKDGKLFDSGTNAKFVPAILVPGFKLGIVGMKVGGRRKLVIPSELGYGHTSLRDPTTGKIRIPRQSTLIFDVDLLNVHTP
jgi:peptidylprolyl isomerase